MFLRRRTARLLALAAWCSFASPAACSAPAVEAPPTPSPPRPEPPATTSAAASSAPPPAPSAAPAPPRDPVDVEMEKVAALLAILSARGVRVPQKAEARIRDEADATTVDRWITRAATCADIDELFTG